MLNRKRSNLQFVSDNYTSEPDFDRKGLLYF